ncbi:hypothetical protein NP233_g8356 [Leucocoprinus birnbaumii]|uniref:Uncharacterized protein n=1 Tax=Leucocoprinus birnbaumii TaxID=56174 RepID=A0AAD5VMP1_9AGAR|nr:hypothetical protein NP233_g8356 [Leucocoprinus birnbaumii]
MSFYAASLPHGLLEMTLNRTHGASSNAFRSATTSGHLSRNSRMMHAAALAVKTPEQPTSIETHGAPLPAPTGRGRRRRGLSLAVRAGLEGPRASVELDKRIKALEVAVVEEEKSAAPASYSEDDLMFLYEDLLAIPAKHPSPPVNLAALDEHLAEQDAETVKEAERRLLQTYPELSTQDTHSQEIDQEDAHPKVTSTYPTHRIVLGHAQRIVSQLEEMRESAMRGSNAEGQPIAGPSKITVPVSVLSIKECESLIRVSTKAQDGSAALLTLKLMQQSRLPIPENAVTDTLELLAKAGDTKGTETLITKFITTPTERQRHLHVKAYINATPQNVLPSEALNVLHSYESKALFAPIGAYTLCIHKLLNSFTPSHRAQAWDLYTHMRYVAHPNPDILLYSCMIRACAFPISTSRTAEPEKALDLWTEMTVDRKIEPSVQAYNAVILACARSGERVYINEAYRLAKEMVDAFRDARGNSVFGPNRATFIALLEAAKRSGDLARARWILAEIVKGSKTEDFDPETEEPQKAEESQKVEVDEEIMMHLFQAYAGYRTPFHRGRMTVVPEAKHLAQSSEAPKSTAASTSSGASAEATSSVSNGPTALTLDSLPSFSHIPPQTHQEVLNETTFLLQRILHDTGVMSGHHEENPHFSPSLVGKFAKVNITSRLIASYIAVLVRHAPLELTRRVFWSIFDQLGVPRTARIYIEALEACSNRTRNPEKRITAIQFGQEIWDKLQEIEDVGHDGEGGQMTWGQRDLSPRIIERAYAARLRLLVSNKQVNQAMALVRLFVERYPPAAIRPPPERDYFQSTRTSLFGAARPLVRMTSRVDIPDDSVPPFLTFYDLEYLHHKLVQTGRKQEMAYLKWVSKSYEWMLRVRRDESYKTNPTAPPHVEKASEDEID